MKIELPEEITTDGAKFKVTGLDKYRFLRVRCNGNDVGPVVNVGEKAKTMELDLPADEAGAYGLAVHGYVNRSGPDEFATASYMVTEAEKPKNKPEDPPKDEAPPQAKKVAPEDTSKDADAT